MTNLNNYPATVDGWIATFCFDMKLFLILTTLPMLFATSCSNCLFDQSEDCEKHYEFTIPISIYPARDTFHIGDTIWIESIVSDTLVNNLDGESVDISSLPLNLIVGIPEYYEGGYISGDFFNYFNEVGAFQPSVLFTRKVFYETDGLGNRHFKVGIIPKSKSTAQGTFCLEFTYFRTDYEKFGVINEHCLDIVKLKMDTNMGRDSGSYSLLPKYYTDQVSQAGFLINGSIAFRVVY